eukprot:UN01745
MVTTAPPQYVTRKTPNGVILERIDNSQQNNVYLQTNQQNTVSSYNQQTLNNSNLPALQHASVNGTYPVNTSQQQQLMIQQNMRPNYDTDNNYYSHNNLNNNNNQPINNAPISSHDIHQKYQHKLGNAVQQYTPQHTQPQVHYLK